VEAQTFLSKQGDNIIEIISKEHSRFIKYDVETGQTLICNYSDDVAKATDLGYEDFRTLSVNTTSASEDDIVRAVVDGVKSGENLPSLIRQLTTKPSYKPLRTIWSKEGKTTTFIGKWDEIIEGKQNGLQKVAEELSGNDLNIYMLSGRFEHPGGFNMLSIEGWNTKVVNEAIKKGIIKDTKAFDDFIWDTYNKPWLESALQRGDDIILWSDPQNIKKIEYLDGIIGPSFYERELEFLKTNSTKYGYEYNKSIELGVFSK
jgi:hypothetical protein